jgi:hypothetical protein
MFEQMLESRAWLASWVAGMALLNYSVGVLVLHEYSRQQFVDHDDWRPPGIGGRLGSERKQLAISVGAVLLVAVMALLADRLVRETLVGGILVMQMAMLSSNVTDVLILRALSAPAAAEGRLRYSAAHRYRSAAARLVGMGLLTVLVAVLYDSLSFLVGSILLLATAAGYHRRARQAARDKRGADIKG